MEWQHDVYPFMARMHTHILYPGAHIATNQYVIPALLVDAVGGDDSYESVSGRVCIFVDPQVVYSGVDLKMFK